MASAIHCARSQAQTRPRQHEPALERRGHASSDAFSCRTLAIPHQQRHEHQRGAGEVAAALLQSDQ